MRRDWFLSFRNNDKHTQMIRQDVYDRGQNALIAHLIEVCPPIVATLEAVPDEIVGWVCRDIRKPIAHYVYVKHAFRRIGIASVLIHGTRYHTHRTRAGDLLVKATSLYNPYLLQGCPCPSPD